MKSLSLTNFKKETAPFVFVTDKQKKQCVFLVYNSQQKDSNITINLSQSFLKDLEEKKQEICLKYSIGTSIASKVIFSIDSKSFLEFPFIFDLEAGLENVKELIFENFNHNFLIKNGKGIPYLETLIFKNCRTGFTELPIEILDDKNIFVNVHSLNIQDCFSYGFLLFYPQVFNNVQKLTLRNCGMGTCNLYFQGFSNIKNLVLNNCPVQGELFLKNIHHLTNLQKISISHCGNAKNNKPTIFIENIKTSTPASIIEKIMNALLKGQNNGYGEIKIVASQVTSKLKILQKKLEDKNWKVQLS